MVLDVWSFFFLLGGGAGGGGNYSIIRKGRDGNAGGNCSDLYVMFDDINPALPIMRNILAVPIV